MLKTQELFDQAAGKTRQRQFSQNHGVKIKDVKMQKKC